MSAGFTFSACSLFYIVLLTIMYFSKQRLKALENKIYGWLIIANLIGVILAISCYYTILNMDIVPVLNVVISKALLLYYLAWISIFTTYVFVVSYDSKDKTGTDKYKHFKKVCKIFTSLFFVIAIPVWLLPLYFYREGSVVYSYGPGANLLYIVIPLYITSFLIYMFKNLKTLKNRKYLPLFAFIFIGTIVMIVQKLNPGLLLMTAMETFVTFLMYFTIENPDIKMIEELNKAKNLSEKYNNDKSIFLFNFVQQVKPSLNRIVQLSDVDQNEKDLANLKNNLNSINEQSNRILNTLNNVFDVSTIDSSKIKIIENEYRVNLLLNEIILKNKNAIEEKGLEFRINLDEGIPEALYGDYIKLKQILNALISNSIKYTDKGFIELTVNSIVKYDICRLIINIEDSGIGIRSEEVDKLFIKKQEEDFEDINIDDNNITLDVIKKMVNLIGGTIMVKSSKKEGSKFTVVLDQRIVEDSNNKTLADFERYKKIQLDKVNVMIVDDEEKNLETLAKKLSNDRINIVTVNGGQLCLERIRNKEKYDLILIDDVLNKLSAGDTEKKLRQIKDFNTPVVVISDSDDNVTRSMYLQTGFNGVITKPIKKKDFEKLIDEMVHKD